MLIKCPECDKEFSDKAQSCPNCGVPIETALDIIKEQENKEKEIKNNRVIDCDGVKIDLSEIYQKHYDFMFDKFGHFKRVMLSDEKVFLEKLYKEMMAIIPSLTYTDAKEMQYYFLRKKTVPHSLKEFRAEYTEAKAEAKKLKAEIDQKLAAKNNARCPYCNSTNTKKISTLSRLGSFATFGFAGKKVGKQWHCNNCKSDF